VADCLIGPYVITCTHDVVDPLTRNKNTLHSAKQPL